MKKRNRPEQLHLDLEWDYLNWLERNGEKIDIFEATTRGLIEASTTMLEKSPVIREILAGH